VNSVSWAVCLGVEARGITDFLYYTLLSQLSASQARFAILLATTSNPRCPCTSFPRKAGSPFEGPRVRGFAVCLASRANFSRLAGDCRKATTRQFNRVAKTLSSD